MRIDGGIIERENMSAPVEDILVEQIARSGEEIGPYHPEVGQQAPSPRHRFVDPSAVVSRLQPYAAQVKAFVGSDPRAWMFWQRLVGRAKLIDMDDPECPVACAMLAGVIGPAEGMLTRYSPRSALRQFGRVRELAAARHVFYFPADLDEGSHELNARIALAHFRLLISPDSPRAWLDLAWRLAARGDLPDTAAALLTTHRLSSSGGAGRELEARMRAEAGPALRRLARGVSKVSLRSSVVAAIEEIVQQKNIAETKLAFADADAGYFVDAEQYMEHQWTEVIYPIIQGYDFTTVLELAPGRGRNTEFLRRGARMVHLVDVNQACIAFCRARFGEERDGCRFVYHVTDGSSLPAVADASITLGYSFDSMVHFDRTVVRSYVSEFARVLVPGGHAFLHTSNLGALKPNSDWKTNPGHRSNMSAELMRQYAGEAGLEIAFQRLSGMADGWGMDELDCFTVVRRPAS